NAIALDAHLTRRRAPTITNRSLRIDGASQQDKHKAQREPTTKPAINAAAQSAPTPPQNSSHSM
ncbi:hypothetical protein, partial [Klebsiella pneumoniae]|uniref:hypothetical protein n=1 Tax=Klebsiella pneumoniae TaxID=573 RepID=UPI00224A5EA5